MKTWAWGALVAVMASAGALTGCGSSSGGTGGGGGAGGAGTTSSSSTSSSSHASTSTSTSTSGSSSSSGGATGSECAMKGTKQECFNCCETDFPMENNILIGDFIQACACAMAADGGTVPCAADPSCKPECATKMYDQNCLNCVNMNAIAKMDACVQAGTMTCANDPKCAAVLTCTAMNCKQAN